MNLLPLSMDLPSMADWWSLVLLHSLWTVTCVAMVTASFLSVVDYKSCVLRSKIAFAGMVLAFLSSIAAASYSTEGTDTPIVAKATTASIERGAERGGIVSQKVSEHEATDSSIVMGENLPPKELEEDGLTVPVFSWRRTVVGVWLLGAVFMLFRLGRSHSIARRWVRQANAEVPEWLGDLLQEVADGLGLLRRVSICVGDQVSGPMVYGILWPVVLLPTSLITGLPPESIRVVLAHELAHVRRGDLLWSLVQRLIESLLFYHPALWWLSRCVDREREAACDAVAVGLVGKRTAVATALVDSAEAVLRPTPAAGLAADGGSLTDRVARLVNPSLRPRFRIPWMTFTLFALLGLTGLLSLSVGTHMVAKQVAVALSPREQMQVIEAAIEESSDPGRWDTKTRYAVSGRFVAPEGKELPQQRNLHINARNEGMSTTASKQDGSFQEQVRGSTPLYVYPLMDGYAPSVYGPFEVKDGPLDLGDLQLKVGFTSRIRVKDKEKKPLAGVQIEFATQWIRIGSGGSGSSFPKMKGLQSNADGIIELRNLAEWPLEIALLKPGYEQTKQEFHFQAGKTVEITLTEAVPLTGRFVDEAGKGIAGVELHYAKRYSSSNDPRPDFLKYLSGKKRYSFPITVTNEAGEFQAESLRKDTEYALMALHADYRPLLIQQVKAGQTLGDLTLEPPLVIRGQIQGDFAKLRRKWRSQAYEMLYRNPIRFGSHSRDGIFLTPVDEQGRFEITQLLAGPVVLESADQSMRIRLTESMDDVVFDLEKGEQSLRKDLRKVRILLKPTGGQLIRGKVQLSWRLPVAPEYGLQSDYKDFPVDEMGRIEGEVPEGADLWFNGSKLVGSYCDAVHFGVIPPGEETLEFTVPLKPAGLFSGRVVDHDGTPITAYRIRASRLTGEEFHSETSADVDHPEGRFSLGPLPLGDEHQYRAALSIEGSWRVAMSDSFQVNEAKPVHNRLIRMPRPVYLSGRVLDAAGKPSVGTKLKMSWSYVSFLGSSSSLGAGAWQKTDGEGRFHVAISSASKKVNGKYDMTIQPHQGSTGRTISFKANRYSRDYDFGDLRMKPSSTVRGKVVGVDGEPRSGVTVAFLPYDYEKAEYRDHRSDKTDEEGGFEITGLDRVRLKLSIYGGAELVEASPPVFLEKDSLRNPWWIIEPDEPETEVTIVVKKSN